MVVIVATVKVVKVAIVVIVLVFLHVHTMTLQNHNDFVELRDLWFLSTGFYLSAEDTGVITFLIPYISPNKCK